MGEWYTYLILSSGYDAKFRLADEDAKQATAGWAGDTYVFLLNENSTDTAFAWLSTWDSQKDSNEFYAASRDYGKARWGTASKSSNDSVTWNSSVDGTATFIQNGKYVLWVVSPNEQVVDTLTPLVYFGGN